MHVAALKPQTAPLVPRRPRNAALWPRAQRRAPDVVAPKRVAAVDDHIALGQVGRQLFDRRFGRRARGQHDPDSARRFGLGDDIGEGDVAATAALGRERLARRGIAVEDDAMMSRAHQAPHDVGAHAPESDHSELHFSSPEVGAAASVLGALDVGSVFRLDHDPCAGRDMRRHHDPRAIGNLGGLI